MTASTRELATDEAGEQPDPAGTSASDPETQDPGSGMSQRQVIRAFCGLLLALLVAILSSTVVSIALPTILADLNGTQSQYTWVVTAMLLTACATTPIWGKLSDLFSKKLLYQIAIVIFTVGSALGGFAQSMPELIGFRALQGIGMGGMQALIQVVMAAMISPRQRGRYSGFIGATFAVATVSGPLLGGLIVDSPLGWRWCFWAAIPIAVAAFIVLGKTLRLPVLKRDVKIDWLGATLLVGGVALLLIWTSLAGESFDWISVDSALYVAGAVVALGLAIFVETRVTEPVVPLQLFRSRTFTLSVLGTLAVGTAMFGGAVFLGQYFQVARGYDPTPAGLMTLPMVIGLFLSSTISGQVVSRIGRTKPFLVGGSISLLVGLSLLSTVDHETNLGLMGVYLALMGIGVGSLMQNLVLVVQNTVGMRNMGSATSVVTFFRTLGGSAGVSALGAVLGAQVSSNITESLNNLGISSAGATNGGGGTFNVEALPGPIQEIVRGAYGDATGTIFLIAACISAVTLVAVLLIKEVPLRTTLDLDSTRTEDVSVLPERSDVVAHGKPAAGYSKPSRGLVVSGTVTGASGEPIAGAALTLTDAAGRQVDRAGSGADGRYQVHPPQLGSFILIAAASQFQPSASMIVVDGASVHRDVCMSGAGGVGGHVHTPDRQAVGGATLVLTDAAGDVVASGVSGGDGWYRFPDLSGDSYVLTVTASGYRPVATPLSVLDGEFVQHDVELTATAILSGTVTSAYCGSPVAEAQVTLMDPAGAVVATGFTDEEGRYGFDDLLEGQYTVVATGYAPTTAEIVLEPGAERGHDVALGYPEA